MIGLGISDSRVGIVSKPRWAAFHHPSLFPTTSPSLHASRRARIVTTRAASQSAAAVDQRTAAAIVKQGTPLHAASLASDYDAIVIGSGMGGLTAAVGLAKFGGKRVLVLEQHYTAGGFTHAFQRGKFAWNVGVHYIGGGVGVRGGELFAPFNAFTGGKVAWAKLPDIHDRLVFGDRVYDIVTGREAWMDKMSQYFPKEEQALRKWLELVDAGTAAAQSSVDIRALPAWLRDLLVPFKAKPWAQLASQPLSDLLDSVTQDKELQAVLAGAWPDIGLPPQRCSAGYYLMLTGHYMEGAYVPAQGASSMAAAMIPAVEEAGGAVVTSADVAQVVVKGGRAVGVKLADGREIIAPVVISNAGLHNTYSRLLPPSVLSANPQLQQQLQQAEAAGSSMSSTVMYLGLDEPLVPEFQGIGALRLYPSIDMDGDAARQFADPDAPLFLEVTCCDGREQIMPDNPAGAAAAAAAAAAEAGRGGGNGSGGGVSTLQLITFANFGWFQDWADTRWHKRGQSYQAFKQQQQERLLERLGQVYPELPGRVAVSEMSTPLSTEHFSRWPQGGFYGVNATPQRYRLTGGLSWGPATPLPGLLLTGQDVWGDGVMAAFLAGTLAARVAGGAGVGLGMLREMKQWA